MSAWTGSNWRGSRRCDDGNLPAAAPRTRGNGKESMTSKKATLIGLTAVILWSGLVGLLRSTTQALGPMGGAVALYTTCSILLIPIAGIPNLKTFPKKYLVAGGLLFCFYEICLTLSLGYAVDTRQTLEIGMVNYLWPSLVILSAVIFNGQKANLLIIPGVVIAFFGLARVLGGDEGIQLSRMLDSFRSNPTSYLLAFGAAFGWAAYCTVTTRMAQGKDGVTLFFMGTAIMLWIKYLLGDYPPINFTFSALPSVVGTSLVLGLGYAAWNVGILHGNTTVLASASYFIPVFSSLVTATLFDTTLSPAFWQGVMLVCVGSLLCWISTRARKQESATPAP